MIQRVFTVFNGLTAKCFALRSVDKNSMENLKAEVGDIEVVNIGIFFSATLLVVIVVSPIVPCIFLTAHTSRAACILLISISTVPTAGAFSFVVNFFVVSHFVNEE